jgi:glycine/serine hydroxymethyltransferase
MLRFCLAPHTAIACGQQIPQSEICVDELKRTDPELYGLIKDEERYQVESIRLIPSENYVSRAVLEATGSVPTRSNPS